MKKIGCVLIAVLFFNGLSYARDYSKVKYNLETPFTGIFTAERFTGDSIVYHDEGKFNSGGCNVYKRSKDGLRDTIFYFSGVIKILEYIYSPEGKLVTANHLVPDRENITGLVYVKDYETNYQYDAEGRIAVITTIANDGKESSIVYDYTKNTIDGWAGGSTSVIYTDSGYICHIKDYSNLGDERIEYVFDSENRLIRMINRPLDGGDPKVSAEYKYTDRGYWVYRGDSYKKEYIYFEKEPILKKVVDYELTARGWEVYQTTDYVYYYGDIALDVNEPGIQKTDKIYGVEGAVVMELEESTQVAIYSISGQLIRRQYFNSGRFHIPMIPGFYVVQAGENVFKLKVK